MSQSPAIELTPQEVAHVFPFHLGFDEHLRIVQLGPSLRKLVPAVANGQLLAEHFAFELPQVRAFVGLSRALDLVAVLRVLGTGARLRGQLVLRAEARRLLFLCSPWRTSSAELPGGRVNDGLELSQLEASRVELAAVPFDLHACLRRVHNLFGARAAAKHLSLGLLIDPHVPEGVCGDELRISQVLVNLIGNAIKFTRAGSVQVAAQLLDERAGELALEISVRDTGVGIAETRHAAIFAVSGGASGSGQGLAICRQLAELMGGGLTVASSPGSGSVFRFAITVRRAGRASSASGTVAP
jgi:signal transduction histidine kinase